MDLLERLSRRQLAALVAVAAVLIGVLIGFFLWPDEEDDEGPFEMSVEDLAALDLGARELVSLAAGFSDDQFHARYEGAEGQGLELWVLGNRRRQLTIGSSGTSIVTQQDGDVSTRCVDAGEGWTCEELPEADAATEDVGLRSSIELLTADLAQTSVTVDDAEIAGVEVRCFSFVSDKLPVEVCLTLDGHVARMDAGESALELTLLDDEVDESDFDLPA